MASNPFNGVATVDGGSFSTTDIAALVQKFEVMPENTQIDLVATLGSDWSTVAQGSSSATINADIRLELDANYANFVAAWDARTTLTFVVRPRTGPTAVANPQVTVTCELPNAPPLPTVADEVLVWSFSVKAITWAWTNGTVSVSRPS